jgi:hypothetical protein
MAKANVTCDFCQGWHDALALQNDVFKCQDVTSIGSDLQPVVSAWDRLPKSIQLAILANIEPDPRAAAG